MSSQQEPSVLLTREQVRRVDEIAQREYGLCGLVLMENAGRNAGEIIRQEFPVVRKALICCGSGNNGGDGFVIARHLRNAGWSVRVLLAAAVEKLSHDASVNFRVNSAMKLETIVGTSPERFADVVSAGGDQQVIVDALLGTGFVGELREPLASLIHIICNARSSGVVAIDVPSGLDCDRGTPCGAAIRADVTVTFVASKVGFETPEGREYTGRVFVADIGVPRELVQRVAGENA